MASRKALERGGLKKSLGVYKNILDRANLDVEEYTTDRDAFLAKHKNIFTERTMNRTPMAGPFLKGYKFVSDNIGEAIDIMD